MLDSIFSSTAELHSPSRITPRKGVIVGLGQVGLACAYSMLIQDCFDELILQDINTEKLRGEQMDFLHGIPFLSPTDVKMGTVADVGRDADIVIITAGAAQKEGESRLSLLGRNVNILKSILKDVVTHCPNAVLLLVSNPVDIMTYATLKITGFPPSRVIGSGTVLDTARLRSLLAKQADVDARSVHAYIIGEHGDSEVPVWSTANIGGVRLVPQGWDAAPESDRHFLDDIFGQVKNAAYEIIKLKGFTSYAIGLATTDIVKAILRSQNRILTVSGLMSDIYDIEDICLSFPRVLNEQGINKLVNLHLSDREIEQLRSSATILKQLAKQLSL